MMVEFFQMFSFLHGAHTSTYNSPDTHISNFSIRSHSEQFASDRIMVILEWTVTLSQTYYQQLLPNVSAIIIPNPGITMAYMGNMTLQLMLAYNTLYNVSLTQPGICGQPDQTAFIELSYSKKYAM